MAPAAWARSTAPAIRGSQRDVAIKILPKSFALDEERLRRFEREARILASLDHRHIAGIYGVEDVEGSKALVLEFVEGLTLAERIERGPLDLHETLTIARQIADAVESAHEQGIIHQGPQAGQYQGSERRYRSRSWTSAWPAPPSERISTLPPSRRSPRRKAW